jgi:hypothetical protein
MDMRIGVRRLTAPVFLFLFVLRCADGAAESRHSHQSGGAPKASYDTSEFLAWWFRKSVFGYGLFC